MIYADGWFPCFEGTTAIAGLLAIACDGVAEEIADTTRHRIEGREPFTTLLFHTKL
ncbi:MAG: hypothetical protein U9N61_03350 [Euryarchaeota archaeon]|nr:hypothetical protein [Euryarchaeota archaeon]